MNEELLKEAEALGLVVDGRWNEDTLRQKIAEAKQAGAGRARIRLGCVAVLFLLVVAGVLAQVCNR